MNEKSNPSKSEQGDSGQSDQSRLSEPAVRSEFAVGSDAHLDTSSLPVADSDFGDSFENDFSVAAVDADTELLTAYLDGELSVAEQADVEQRLVGDESFRDHMQRLQASWDLLDTLELPHAEDRFIKTTMEMVAHEAGRQQGRGWVPDWMLVVLGVFVLPLGVMCAGYVMAGWQQAATSEQLLDDLPMLEQLDRYLAVDLDQQFLAQLHESDLFTPDMTSLFPEVGDGSEVGDGTGAVSPGEPDSEGKPVQNSESVQRNESGNNVVIQGAADGAGVMAGPEVSRVPTQPVSLTARQLESLRRNRAEFDSLPPSRQRAVRKFHRGILDGEDSAGMQQTLRLYYDWLKSLGQSERISLLDTTDSRRRLAIIEETRKQQQLEAFGKEGATQLPLADAEHLFQWYDRLVQEHKQQIRRAARTQYVRYYQKRFDRDPPANEVKSFGNRPLGQLVAFILKSDRELVKRMITDEDISRLKIKISQPANAILDDVASADARTTLILNWVDAANQSRFSIDNKALRRFYYQLPAVERDDLNNLSPTQWKESLIRKYRRGHLTGN